MKLMDQQDDLGFELISPQKHLSQKQIRRYIKNSERLNDHQLDTYIKKLQDRVNQENNKNSKASLQLLKQQRRDLSSLETYDKYQDIWYHNVQKFINSRDRLNRAGIHKNHRENMLQSRNDVTLQDRLEQIYVEKQNVRKVLGAYFSS